MNHFSWFSLFQILAILLVGYSLIRIYRWTRFQSPLIGAILAIGLLTRLSLGLLLFTVSYLDLPLLQNLHSGNGFWRVAPDARDYNAMATDAALRGLSQVNPAAASPTYTFLLAIWVSLVGASPASGMFLNVFCYALLALLLVLVAKPSGQWRRDLPCILVLASFSLSPVLVIHGTQSLKDELFTVLTALTGVGVFLILTPLIHGLGGVDRKKALVLGTAAILLGLFAMAGIRWYYSYFVLCGMLLGLALVAPWGGWQRLRRVLALGLPLLILALVACEKGSGVYGGRFTAIAVASLEGLVSLTRGDGLGDLKAALYGIGSSVEQARSGYTWTGGGTILGKNASPAAPAATALPSSASLTTASPSAESTSEASRAIAPLPARATSEAPAAATRTTVTAGIAASQRVDPNPITSPPTAPQTTAPAPASPTLGTATSDTAATSGARTAVIAEVIAPPGIAPNPVAPQTTAPAPAAPNTLITQAPAPPELASAPVTSRAIAPRPAPSSPAVTPGSAPEMAIAPKALPPQAVGEAAKPAAAGDSSRFRVGGESGLERLSIGLAVLLVPITLLQWLSVVEIAGGRGLLFVTDIDTLFLDASILAMLALLYRRRHLVRRHLFFVFVLLAVAIVSAGLLAYVVTNFGSLFRLRLMFAVPLWLLSLAALPNRSLRDPETIPSEAVSSGELVTEFPVGQPPIRVMRVITRLNVGGPALHVSYCAELDRHGFDQLLVYGSTEADEGSLEDLVTGRAGRTCKLPDLGRRIRPWSDLRVLFQLTRLTFREQPDIIHTHTAKAGVLARLAALAYNLTRPRSRRCAVVHTFHGHVLSGYFGPVGSFLACSAERVMTTLTDRILAISAGQRDDICRLHRVAPLHKTRVVELAAELEPLLELKPNGRLRSELGFAADDIVFGYVGRFVPIKDLPNLIHAFQRVSSQLEQTRLVLVGDGHLRPDLERLVDDLGLRSKVRFTGWRRDLDTIYAGIDVAVLSSLNEGTPLALVEAMAAGRPAVATGVGGVEDVVSDGKTGLTVPPGDTPRLAQAMAYLAAHPEVRIHFGQAARDSVSVRFSKDRLVMDIGRCYRELLPDKRGARQFLGQAGEPRTDFAPAAEEASNKG